MSAKVNALVDGWKGQGLTLSDEQEKNLKDLFTEIVQKAHGRREAAKKVIEELAAAKQANDTAKTEELLKKLREGLRQVSAGREGFLDAFDQILDANQRATILLTVVQQAKSSGKPVEQLIDDLLIQSADS